MSLRTLNPYYRWVFPWLLDRVSRVVAPQRQQLLQRAKGQVLEIGAGTGTSFHCYAKQVDKLYALEPDIGVMDKARRVLARLPVDKQVQVELLLGDAQQIPLQDNSCDTVVCFLVLCSVPDVEQVLAEIRRVLKPDGEFLFFEHVLSEELHTQRWQERLNPYWHRCAGGCQLNRETAAYIESAGFHLMEFKRYRDQRFPALVGNLVTGVATSSS
ncbi:MAG: class I SAM-dependent methyltransferase [Amphritea sp.]